MLSHAVLSPMTAGSVGVGVGVGVGVFSPMTAGSVGVGRFVTKDCWKRGGVFYLFLTDFDVIEWA